MKNSTLLSLATLVLILTASALDMPMWAAFLVTICGVVLGERVRDLGD